MDFSNYQKLAHKTAIYPNQGTIQGLMYATLGLTGEAGEIANKVKKIYRDSTSPADIKVFEELVKELGDVLWYAAEIASCLSADLGIVATSNIQKLEQRAAAGKIGGSGDNR